MDLEDSIGMQNHDHDHGDHGGKRENVREVNKVPVTIVTGFLGAGKTTLINHILKDRHGRRIAVIENEFGAESIDDKLGIAEKLETQEDFVMLDNGCVCCTVRKDLQDALAKLAAMDTKFEAVVIELSGMADPAPVAFTIEDTELTDHFMVDSIVCVADAKHVSQHLKDQSHDDDDVNEAVQQVAFADRILLNKIDCVTDRQKAAVVNDIRSINSVAKLIECTHSKVHIDTIVNVKSFTIEQANKIAQELEYTEEEMGDLDNASNKMDCCKTGSCANTNGNTMCNKELAQADGSVIMSGESGRKRKTRAVRRRDGRSHKFGGVTSVSIKLSGEMHPTRLSKFLDSWLPQNGANLFRTKGILAMANSPKKWVLQGVHEMLNFYETPDQWTPEDPPRGVFVFIGRKVHEFALRKGLTECLMRSGEVVNESM